MEKEEEREPSPESKPTPQWSSPIPSLPYDVVLLCVARVSRLYYPTLSLVSKSFRSLVSSPELYKTRSLLGFTESCLYVCIQDVGGSADWYTLCLKPNKTLKKNKTGYALVASSFEVLDTETWVWDSLSISSVEERERVKTFCIDGKFHVVTDEEVLAYDPKLGEWDRVERRMGGLIMCSDDYCVIGNVLYSVSEGVFRWYDTEGRKWRDLLGLVGLPKITHDKDFIRLGDYGRKMVVSWGTALWPYYRKVWCAEIALERRPDTSEIWGNVVWFDELLKIDIYSQVDKVLSTTL